MSTWSTAIFDRGRPPALHCPNPPLPPPIPAQVHHVTTPSQQTSTHQPFAASILQLTSRAATQPLVPALHSSPYQPASFARTRTLHRNHLGSSYYSCESYRLQPYYGFPNNGPVTFATAFQDATTTSSTRHNTVSPTNPPLTQLQVPALRVMTRIKTQRPRSLAHSFFLLRWLPTPCQTSCFVSLGNILSLPGTNIVLPVAVLQLTQPYTYKCVCTPSLISLISSIAEVDENECMLPSLLNPEILPLPLPRKDIKWFPFSLPSNFISTLTATSTPTFFPLAVCPALAFPFRPPPEPPPQSKFHRFRRVC
jgi:hypothetical protein